MDHRESIQFVFDVLVVCCLGFAYVAILTVLSVVHAALRAARAINPISDGRQKSESGSV
jgi:hypothetical protein